MIRPASVTLVICLFCASPSFSLEWWPKRHHFTSVRTESFPQNTVPTILVWHQPQESWDRLVRWYNEDPAGGRSYLGHVTIEDDAGNTIKAVNFRLPVFAIFECQADSDTALELCVTYKDKQQFGMSLFDWPEMNKIGQEFKFLQSDFAERGNDHWDIWMKPCFLLPGGGLNGGDGLAFQVFAGWQQIPRGILVIDVATGKEVWHNWKAAPPDAVSLDSSRPDSLVILWAAGAPATGARAIDTADTCGYIIGLSATGRDLWKRGFPVTFSIVNCVSFDGLSGRASSFELVSAYDKEKQPTVLRRIDAYTGEILKERRLEVSDGRCYLTGSETGDGDRRLIVNNYHSKLTVFNDDLDSLWSTRHVSALYGTFDLNGDGTHEIPVTTPDGLLEVYDLEGNVLIAEKLHGLVKDTQRIRSGEISRVWMITDQAYTGYDITENRWYYAQFAAASSGYAVSVLIIFWLMAWSYRTRRAYVRARNEKLVLEGWAQLTAFQAHDSKKPIAVAQRTLDNLETRISQQYPDANVRAQIDRLRGEFGRMLQTTRQIQVVSRVNKPDFQEHDLNDLVANTVERMNLLELAPVVFKNSESHIRIRFDYRLVESLLENVIGNAMEASSNGCPVDVGIERAETGKDGILITVSDSGPGMSPEVIEGILQSKGSLKPGGQGLGILSAKWIAETHHGTLLIESQVGNGTTVSVFLPANGGE